MGDEEEERKCIKTIDGNKIFDLEVIFVATEYLRFTSFDNLRDKRPDNPFFRIVKIWGQDRETNFAASIPNDIKKWIIIDREGKKENYQTKDLGNDVGTIELKVRVIMVWFLVPNLRLHSGKLWIW